MHLPYLEASLGGLSGSLQRESDSLTVRQLHLTRLIAKSERTNVSAHHRVLICLRRQAFGEGTQRNVLDACSSDRNAARSSTEPSSRLSSVAVGTSAKLCRRIVYRKSPPGYLRLGLPDCHTPRRTCIEYANTPQIHYRRALFPTPTAT